jgi:hypothetical protein
MYFPNLQLTPAMWENMYDIHNKLMNDSWETETSIANRKPAHPLIINLGEISEEENCSDDWPVPLE